MIRATALAKHFGSLRAVDGIDLDVAQGEFFAFLGPNAAGKTTTIKMLTALFFMRDKFVHFNFPQRHKEH